MAAAEKTVALSSNNDDRSPGLINLLPLKFGISILKVNQPCGRQRLRKQGHHASKYSTKAKVTRLSVVQSIWKQPHCPLLKNFVHAITFRALMTALRLDDIQPVPSLTLVRRLKFTDDSSHRAYVGLMI